MKTRFYVGLIALAALTFVGCAKDEVKSSVDNAIEFGTYLGRDAQTKGSVFDTATMQGENVGFGVFAYYTDEERYSAAATPNFMNNQQVTYNGSAWTYAPVKYWPNEATDYVSFFAYAPYREGFSVPTSGDPIISFAVGTDVTNHIDLVAAENSHIDCQKQAVNDVVKFTFKHALSRVGFKVEAVMDEVNDQENKDKDKDNQENPITDGTTISVQEVELIGNFYTTGKLNLNGAVWTPDEDGKTGSYTLKAEDFTDVAKAVTIDPKVLNKNTEYMMLIPTKTIAVKVRVKYTVTTADDKLSGGASVVENDITSDEFAFTFDQGKAYTFVLHLGLTSVKLDAEVAEWEDMGDYVVNVPNNFVN